jgi:hypothetical protein
MDTFEAAAMRLGLDCGAKFIILVMTARYGVGNEPNW